MEGTESYNFSAKYLENLLQGNRLNCSAIAKQYLAQNHSFLELYEEVFKVALYEVGRLWEINQISVASEHITTAITEGILNEYFERIISKNRLNRKVVVACVENEKHQVGIKMVADTFEMHGWESFFLGAGIPLKELIQCIHEVKPDMLAISLSIYSNFANLIKMLNKLREEFPELQIIIGGQAFKHLSTEMISKVGNVVILTDLYLLEKFINVLNSK